MTFNSIRSLIKLFAVGTVLSFASAASAALISGDITFSGDWDSLDPLLNTTVVTFPGNDAGIDDANGDFSGISQGDTGTLGVLDFGAGGPGDGVFFSIAGYDFTLNALTVALQTSSILLVEGTGEVSGNGMMITPVTFTFSANNLGGLNSFSAGFTAAPVPVPGALILFGSALAALGLRRK